GQQPRSPERCSTRSDGRRPMPPCAGASATRCASCRRRSFGAGALVKRWSAAPAPCSDRAMETVVKTGYGEVRGGTEDGVAVFKGLPYAAPPFGERRLQPPGRPEPWDGVRDALAYGPTAPHGPYPA